MKAHLILGNQLFKDCPAEESKNKKIILIESIKSSNKYRYHKLKLVFMFSSMRHYKKYLEDSGFEVIYIKQSELSILDNLKNIIKENNIDELTYMQPVDLPARKSMASIKVKQNILPNQLHITTDEDFANWYKDQKKPVMEQFYRFQRKRLNILMEGGKPEGGEWNYDKANRMPLPKDFKEAPSLPEFEIDDITKEVIEDVDKNFKNNPGSIDNIWFPVNFEQAEVFLEDFVSNRLNNFGKYEDAIKDNEPLLYHSALSACLNNGLLTVNQVIEKVLAKNDVPLSSKEGFIRQVIGWREYMYGLYINMPDLLNSNYFGFKKNLEDYWFNLEVKEDLPVPVKNSLRTLNNYAYNHHIERLMVLGNWFLLNEYNPKSVNDWFMSMYIDAYEWVMVPNVIGMSQYGDGGRVATKPYISGDAYLKKMGRYNYDEDFYTNKYWEFLSNNYEKLKNNPRMSLALNNAKKRK